MKARAFRETNRQLSVRLTSIVVAAVFVMGTFFIPSEIYGAETDEADVGAKAEASAEVETDVIAAEEAVSDVILEELPEPDTQNADSVKSENVEAEDVTPVADDAANVAALEDLLVVTDEDGNAIGLEDLNEDEYDGFIYKVKDDATKTEIKDMEKAIASGGYDETGQVAEITDSELYEADSIEAIGEVADADMIESIEPNYIVKAFAVPNDPFYEDRGWYLRTINAPYVWDKGVFGKGKDDDSVAVLDSGVNMSHADFKTTTFKDPFNATAETEADSENVTDNSGHGTAMAGIIAAAYNNGKGLTGIMPETTIMPVKVLDVDANGEATGSFANVIRGINHAVSHGADVISMSFGGAREYDPLEEACQQAADAGVILIASAGNDGNTVRQYPASFDSVISVGSIEEDGSHSSFSNYNECVDVVAPGRGIWAPTKVVTQSGMRYSYYSSFFGTSFSAPQVAAMAAMIRSIDDSVDTAGFKEIIKATSIDKGPAGRDDYFGYGLMDLSRAYGYMTGNYGTFTAAISGSSYVFDGNVKTPAVTVKTTGMTMLASDYKVNYPAGRKAVGMYSVSVTGQGLFQGTKTLNYKIVPPLVKKIRDPKLCKKNKKKIKVRWSAMSEKQKAKYKSAITGYQVRVSKKSNFKKAKYVKVKGAAKTSAVVKGLKRKTTYYVQYRAYKTVGKTTYYSKWSGKKKVKTK